MVAEHSHQKTTKTTGRLSFSQKKEIEIENEKPVRTTGRLIVFFFLLNIKIEIAEGSENARPLSNILFLFRNEKVRKKPSVLIVLMSTE